MRVLMQLGVTTTNFYGCYSSSSNVRLLVAEALGQHKGDMHTSVQLLSLSF